MWMLSAGVAQMVALAEVWFIFLRVGRVAGATIRPGELSRAEHTGKRARFIAPLRKHLGQTERELGHNLSVGARFIAPSCLFAMPGLIRQARLSPLPYARAKI